MKIYGTFKDRDNNTVTVQIYNIDKTGNDINIDTSDWIRFGSEPVTITTDCEDSFTHIIKKSCEINLVTKRWMGDYLFANNATSIVVNVFRTINNVTKCLFAGYVTPNSFNQDYARPWETITINCIDNLGVMMYRNQNDEKTWSELIAESQVRTFKHLLENTHLRDRDYIISNMPQTTITDQMIWVETAYERVVDENGNVSYHVVETQVKPLDSNTAVTTTNTQTGNTPLTVTYIQSQDVTLYNGVPYYKKYAYVTINGESVNTGDWILGDEATSLMPTVVGSQNTLIGWSYGALTVPFEYYDYYRVDKVMSDGAIKEGWSDTLGSRIPESPQTTPEGSYYEFRQGDASDLDEDNGTFYYKNYAWVIQEIDGETVESKTNDWMRGNPYSNQQNEP